MNAIYSTKTTVVRSENACNEGCICMQVCMYGMCACER